MAESWLLEDLARSVRREWRILVSVIVVALVLAVAATVLWPQEFEAAAVLTVETTTVAQPGQATGAVNMDTERIVATSSEVLALAAKSIPNSTVEELRDSLVVSVPKGAQVLTFTLTADTPDAAAAGANAIAKAYHENRVATAKQLVDGAVDNLASRIAELTTQAGTLPADSVVRATLEAQIQALQERQVLLESTAFNAGSLVSPAVAPTSSTQPSAVIIFGAAIVLGAFVGVFAALLRARERRHRRALDAAEAAS